MSIKYNEEKDFYTVQVSARHPVTKKPRSLKRIGFKTKAEAEREEKKMMKELLLKFNDAIHPSWSSVATECLENLRLEKGDTRYLDDLQTVISKHANPAWGRRAIDGITTFEVKQLVLEGVTDVTQARRKDILKHLRQVFDFAKEKGYIRETPYPKLSFKINQKKFKTLSESQVKKLLAEAFSQNHLWKEIWATGVYTGMRSGEMYALRPEHVDFERNLIHVCSSFSRKEIVDMTKGKYDRFIDLAPPLKKIFLRLMEENPQREFMLPRSKEWDSNLQAEVLRKFLKSIGLPSIRFHDLRATWCTVLLNFGVAAEKVRAMGGWKDTKSFQRYIDQSGIQISGSLSVLEKFGHD